MSIKETQAAKFFVVLPENDLWETPCSKTVFKGKLRKDKFGITTIQVIAPKSFAEKWPTVLDSIFIKCSGPARELTDREYVELIHQLRPKIPLPKEWRS